MINETVDYLIQMTKFLNPKEVEEDGIVVKLHVTPDNGAETCHINIEDNDDNSYYEWYGETVEGTLAEAIKDLASQCEEKKQELENLAALGESITGRKVG